MKLIIDISENIYDIIMSDVMPDEGQISAIITRIYQGTPLDERPHGKWIKVFENPFTNGYVCPFCGHKIQVTEQFLPEVIECEVCGADMRETDND